MASVATSLYLTKFVPLRYVLSFTSSHMLTGNPGSVADWEKGPAR